MLQVQSPIHSITDMKPGEHACCIYGAEEEHRNIVTPFLREGLEQNEKVVYIVDVRDPQTIINYLKSEGVDVEHYQKKGQFSILTSTDTYLKGGIFDPDGMVSILSSDTQKALDEGYAALRATGEMSWALRGLPGSDRLMEYEDKLDNFFSGSKLITICQYDRRCFSKEQVHDILAIHPFVVIGTSVNNNFYYVPPEERANDLLSGNHLNSWISNLTDRTATEDALRDSEMAFKALAENAYDGILVAVSGGAHTYANRRASEITGYTITELQTINIKYLVVPEELERVSERLRKILQGESIPPHYETLIISKEGKRVPIDVTSAKTIWHGQPADMVIIRDISERKQVEEQLKQFNEELEWQVHSRTAELKQANSLLEAAIVERTLAEESVRKSLHERELLLREIHHRVRNNLQIILSLISLQSPRIKDPVLLETMGDFQNRIMAMAHVHERMCRSRDISRIDLSEIVTFLGTNLFKTYNVSQQNIRFTVEIKDLQISIESAIPLSLIINELVSNSLKHAFPQGAPGEITVSGRREGDTLVFSIGDTGIGIQKELDWRKPDQTLGFKLVVGLVQQLNGMIELDRTTGTAFKIVVMEKE